MEDYGLGAGEIEQKTSVFSRVIHSEGLFFAVAVTAGIWLLLGWFVGLMVATAGYGKAGSCIFLSWGIVFICTMAYLHDD